MEEGIISEKKKRNGEPLGKNGHSHCKKEKSSVVKELQQKRLEDMKEGVIRSEKKKADVKPFGKNGFFHSKKKKSSVVPTRLGSYIGRSFTALLA